MGAAFAAELCDRGLNVLLVDREGDLLADQADALRTRGTEVDDLVVDLADPSAAAVVAAAANEVDTGLLVSNAAVGLVGPFIEHDLDALLNQLDVNCRTPLELVHRFLPRLVKRGRGGIVMLSSASALRGAPIVAAYAATKAWNLILAESLWEEARHDGVDVLAVLPGSTRTPNWLASNPQPSAGTAIVMEPADVAREALDALGRTPSVIPGQENRDGQALFDGMDRADAVAVMGEIMRDMFPPGRPETSPKPA